MSQNSSKIPFLKSILCLLIVYLLGHMSPFLPSSHNPILNNLSLQSLAFAEEDDDGEG
ncbi:MAG: hypothetical protein CM1200mP16_04040 [Nitrospina sp.]|nr:MAG: hypothetical protein CM1200mP16_04040 [Nitrospina sp.]